MRKHLRLNDSLYYNMASCEELRGDRTGLSGDYTGLWGDCTGLWGDCTGISGNIDKCYITASQRANGLHISELVSDEISLDEIMKLGIVV